jgi:ferredoxin
MAVEVDEDRCNGCGLCVAACARLAILVDDEVAEVDPFKCDSCGDCVVECPNDALWVPEDFRILSRPSGETAFRREDEAMR